MTLEIVRFETPDPSVEGAILAPLVAFNEQAHGPANWAPLAFVLREPGTATIAGGLWGACFYDWCVVRLLAVPQSARGQGLGTKLMAAAEAVAHERRCTGIWLDTFSFQARPFYEKLGFTVFGELAGHPTGGSRIFLQKRLPVRLANTTAPQIGLEGHPP